MENINNCCLDCNGRKFLCHSNCERYAEFKKMKAKQKAFLNEGKEADAYAATRNIKCRAAMRRVAKLIKFHRF